MAESIGVIGGGAWGTALALVLADRGHAVTLWMFEQDPKTKAVVMTGEIGGVYEERAVDTIKKMKTPVIAMIGGIFAPPGKRMGHAGAIVEGKMGTAKEKLEALKPASCAAGVCA